jgi:uncharacterized protein (TIGR00290 family)
VRKIFPQKPFRLKAACFTFARPWLNKDMQKQKPKALLSWSSGKDSAWALHTIRQTREVEIAGLVTTLNERYDRVAMHAVRVSLLEQQAASVDVPLWKVPIPDPCSNEQYEAAMRQLLEKAKAENISYFVFGDLFLEDIRQYRERQLADTGITPLFPLWNIPTDQLARKMVQAGLRAYITCVDPKQIDRSFAGRIFDKGFLNDLPASVDPCGERGEFHSFAFAGPMFRYPLEIKPGEIVERDGFVFADIF